MNWAKLSRSVDPGARRRQIREVLIYNREDLNRALTVAYGEPEKISVLKLAADIILESDVTISGGITIIIDGGGTYGFKGNYQIITAADITFSNLRNYRIGISATALPLNIVDTVFDSGATNVTAYPAVKVSGTYLAGQDNDIKIENITVNAYTTPVSITGTGMNHVNGDIDGIHIYGTTGTYTCDINFTGRISGITNTNNAGLYDVRCNIYGSNCMVVGNNWNLLYIYGGYNSVIANNYGGGVTSSLIDSTVGTGYNIFGGNTNIITGTKNLLDTDKDLDESEVIQLRVKNATASPITKGSIVYINGGTGNNPLITLANNTTDATSANTLGMVTADIAVNGFGYVLITGMIYKVNTDSALGFTAGGTVYLGSTPGTYTSTKPTQPNHEVRIGVCVRVSATVGSIFIRVQNGYELEELHDVLATGITKGDILVRNGSNLWVNLPVGTNTHVLTADSTTATGVKWAAAGGGGSGTVTTVSVVSANGLAGTVANPTTTPAITLSTTVTGLLKGNGTAISAASSGTDYAPATSGTSILYGNGAGGFSNATVGTSLSFSAGTLALADGDKGDITVATSGTAWSIDAGVVTNAKLANVSTATFKGRTTAGSGSPEDLTGTQATALLDTFTSTLKGLAPASGGGTTNFLRADGTWAAPAGGGSPSIGGTITGGTAGSILFVDPAATIAQDNAELFWDNTNNELGIGITTPDTKLHVHNGTAGVVTANANTVITAENNTSAFVSVLSPAANDGGVLFGSPTSNSQGGIVYNHPTDRLDLRSNGNTTQLNANTAGVAIGLGNTIAATRLEIGGTNAYITMPTELTSASPTNPATNKMILIGQRIANRGMLSVKGNVGHESALQPYMGHNKVATYSALPGIATLPSTNGISFTTQIGTLTARIPATTNALTYMHRYGIVSAAAAGSLSHQRSGSAAAGAGMFFVGNSAVNRGGFVYVVRFGISDAATVTGARMFIGLRNDTAAPTNVEPSTIVNCVGIAQLATDGTQLYIVYGGTTAQAAIALGAANFPINSTTPYELALYSPSDALRTVHYEVTNLNTGAIATGTLSGTAIQMPAETLLLTAHHWRTNNATALAVGLDICQIYAEMDQ